ncbi:MAG: GNAT family N-acetyltransferase [Gaiellaceae bacterium]
MSGDPWLELAENANTYTPLGPKDERIVTDRYVLWMGPGNEPGWNVAQRFRFDPGELTEVRAEIHGHLRERGRDACSWEVGTHARPDDLVQRLHALGLVDDSPTALAIGMVLTEEPPSAPPDVEVRRVETDDDYYEAERIAAIAFEMSALPKRRPYVPDPNNTIYLAYADGQPVARASASFGERGATLFGGSTLPAARGRGAYRALVAARWQDAVDRGTPVLVTQAGPMSRPILTRLGFREVCSIRILVDRFERGDEVRMGT